MSCYVFCSVKRVRPHAHTPICRPGSHLEAAHSPSQIGARAEGVMRPRFNSVYGRVGDPTRLECRVASDGPYS